MYEGQTLGSVGHPTMDVARNRTSQIRDNSTIDQALDRLDNLTGSLQEHMTKLESRLSPVLQSSALNGSGANGGQPERAPSCPIEDRIMGIERRIACFNATIARIQSELCV